MPNVTSFIHELKKFFRTFIQKYREDQEDNQIEGDEHGGDDVVIQEDTDLVIVNLTSSGRIELIFTPLFTNNFFLEFTQYGAKIFGISDPVIAFRESTAAGITTLHTGLDALLGDGDTILQGGTVQTMQVNTNYSIFKFFDHRIRVEVETQIGIPSTTVWSTNETQQLSNVIATFPIQTQSFSKIEIGQRGVRDVELIEGLKVGNIVFRSSADRINERFLLNNSKFFHNIRLEPFVVKRVYKDGVFKFIREKLTYDSDDFWTAKLRFRSV